MGTELNTKQIDTSVGGLVWIRRRNGSWWPGRIMGMDELPESSLVTARTGTPVKLLGKENSCLDWYNLEKSKRVKAFRCGEFGKCIEKARAFAAQSNKKPVKYARREDAILHALELESARDFDEDNSSGKQHGAWVENGQSMCSPSKGHQFIDAEVSKLENSSVQEICQSGISFDDQKNNNRKTPNFSEDDRVGGAKRVRGLGDLAIGVETKKSTKMCVHTEGSHELVQLRDASVGEPDIHSSLASGSPVVKIKSSCSSLKRTRSPVTNSCENLKRRDRRRQLKKVLECTTMVSVPVRGVSSDQSYLQGLKKNNDSTNRGISCQEETSLDDSEYTKGAGGSSNNFSSQSKEQKVSSLSEIPENERCDNLFDVPLVEEEQVSGGAIGRQSSGLISLSNEGLIESGSVSIAVHINSISQRARDTSRWQWKGRTNSRSLVDKATKSLHLEGSIDKNSESDDLLAGTPHKEGYCFNPDIDIDAFDESFASNNGTRGIHRIGELNHLDAKSATCLSSLMPRCSFSRKQSRFTTHSRYDEIADLSSRNTPEVSSLVDVYVEVRTNYRDPHIPIVSLMSKYSGKAIIGHSLTVEVCDDGYSDVLMTNAVHSPTSPSCELQSIQEENVKAPLTSPAKRCTGKPYSSRKRSSKSRKCGLANSQKTRRLSSFSVPHFQRKSISEQVMKKLERPVINCVPLTIVFSRINEAFSTRPTRGTMPL